MENKEYKKHIIYILIICVLLIIIFAKKYHKDDTEYILPKEIYFAGQKIDLKDQKTYERIDTEFQILVNDRRGQIKLWLKRMNKYGKIIKSILDKEEMHHDYIYLAIKESSLLHCSESIAGAKGWWQFIAGTARDYGLTINDYIDERCDIYLSTTAAMKYLKKLNTYFKGDIISAMAAYNDGEGDVLKMLDVQGSKDYFSSYTNSETMRYIPGIIALKIILDNPKQYGFHTDNEYPELILHKLEFMPEEDINIYTLSFASGLDFLEFISYNSHLRITYTIDNYLPKDKTYNIYLPKPYYDNLKDFINN